MYLQEVEFKLSVITNQLNLPSQGVIVIWEWICHDPQPFIVMITYHRCLTIIKILMIISLTHLLVTKILLIIMSLRQTKILFIIMSPGHLLVTKNFLIIIIMSLGHLLVTKFCWSCLWDIICDHVSETSFGDSNETNCGCLGQVPHNPGYYAGIKITRLGYWSREVCHSASTR